MAAILFRYKSAGFLLDAFYKYQGDQLKHFCDLVLSFGAWIYDG